MAAVLFLHLPFMCYNDIKENTQALHYYPSVQQPNSRFSNITLTTDHSSTGTMAQFLITDGQ